MTRRARRPSFDRNHLFGALAVARHQSILAGAHEYGSLEHVLAHKIADAIDALAERLTGNKEYFWGSLTVPRSATQHVGRIGILARCEPLRFSR